MQRWTRWISVVLAIAIVSLVAGEADAQRRGRGRRGRRTTETATETTPPPPEDPFAEGSAGATGTEAGGATSGSTGATAGTSGTGTAGTGTSGTGAAGTGTSGTGTSGTGTAGTGTTAPTTGTTGTGTVAPAAQVAPQAPVSSGTSVVDPGPTPPDLAPLRQEYVAIMDEMVQARSRVAILGQELFQTRMTVQVQDRTGDEATLARFVLELDGTPIYDSEGEIEGGDQGRQVFEGALAPGPHVLTLEMEQRAREDTEYRVTQRESFRFVVVRERLTEVTIVLEDDSDIARAFPSGGEGHFDVRTRLRVATRALPRS